jgi:YVTN family beta-propeller protein
MSTAGDNTVSVIDCITNAVVATIAVGTGPTDVSANPSTNIAYVVQLSMVTAIPQKCSVLYLSIQMIITILVVDYSSLIHRHQYLPFFLLLLMAILLT